MLTWASFNFEWGGVILGNMSKAKQGLKVLGVNLKKKLTPKMGYNSKLPSRGVSWSWPNVCWLKWSREEYLVSTLGEWGISLSQKNAWHEISIHSVLLFGHWEYISCVMHFFGLWDCAKFLHFYWWALFKCSWIGIN